MIKKEKTFLCLMLFVLMCVSCEQRDPQAEYELIRDTAYSSPREGEEVAQEYIDYFYDEEKARITEVSEIRDQYRKMDAFFSGTFNYYPDFLKRGKDLNNELSYSNYDGVRTVWKSLYEKERTRLLGPLMDSITESNFEDFFKAQVYQLCEKKYNIWEVESIDQLSLSTPTLVNDGTAKKCYGEYRVHLRGNVFGLLTKDARVSIEGTIGPDESGYLTPFRTGYEFD